MRKIGIAMLTTAWWIVSHTAQTQFTSNHRPYQARVPRSIQPGSKNDFTARPSSMIPYAAPRRRMLGHPVFQRTAVSRMTRTPAPYSQINNSAAIGFSHSRGGVDPESISAMIGDRRTRARRGRRFGWAPMSAMVFGLGRTPHKGRGNKVTGGPRIRRREPRTEESNLRFNRRAPPKQRSLGRPRREPRERGTSTDHVLRWGFPGGGSAPSC